MSNIPKIKTIIRPCKTYINMGEVLNPNTNVLDHIGLFGQYSKHPNHNSTVQDVSILTDLWVLNLFDLKVFLLIVDWQIFVKCRCASCGDL